MTHTLRLLPLAASALLTACAAPRHDGQWSDPSFASRTLRDASVLVSCRGADGTLARLCEDRLSAALREAGARPVVSPQPADASAGADAIARSARDAGATVAVLSSITVAGVVAPPPGPTFGFGLGGGFGRGGFGYGGIGVSIPIGGAARPLTAYASHTALIDAASGREFWSVRTTSPRAEDAAVQIAGLARTGVAAMRDSGLFETR
jgi:hypothetical protein